MELSSPALVVLGISEESRNVGLPPSLFPQIAPRVVDSVARALEQRFLDWSLPQTRGHSAVRRDARRYFLGSVSKSPVVRRFELLVEERGISNSRPLPDAPPPPSYNGRRGLRTPSRQTGIPAEPSRTRYRALRCASAASYQNLPSATQIAYTTSNTPSEGPPCGSDLSFERPPIGWRFGDHRIAA